MARLANTCAGRVLLHLLALFGDRAFAFHLAGIGREMTPAESFDRAQPTIVVLSVIGFSVACFFTGV
jgi:hypothetical protein